MSVAVPFDHERTREDSEAARLYADYSDRIFAYCLGRLGSRSEAEDAVQVTFLQALRALRRGVVPESESAWLYAIAKNVCHWQLRTLARRPLSGERCLESLASPEQNEEERELVGGLRDALESLPERQRHALLLREWRGLSAQEIAVHLGLSPPATHALLTRARRSLALALTTAQRAALGVASLAYELRAWLKGALGGASTKVAVATVAIVGTGAGGAVVTLDQRSAGERPAPDAAAFDLVAGDLARATQGGDMLDREPDARRARPATVAEGGRGLAESAGRDGERTAIRPWILPRGRPADDSGPPRVEAPAPTVPPGDSEPAASSQALPIPQVEPPSVDLPPVDLPAVDLAPPDAPTVEVPPVETAGDSLLTVDLPPVDVPTVDLPTIDLPPLGD